MSYVSPLSGISGLSLDSTLLLSSLLFFCLLPSLFLPHLFFCSLAHSTDFFPEILSIYFMKRWAFGMARIQQLAVDGWLVVWAACCHMALVFAIMRS